MFLNDPKKFVDGFNEVKLWEDRQVKILIPNLFFLYIYKIKKLLQFGYVFTHFTCDVFPNSVYLGFLGSFNKLLLIIWIEAYISGIS